MKTFHAMALALSFMISSGASVFAADIVDFEGLDDGKALGTVTTPTNAVTFGVGTSSPTLPAYVAGVGLPETAFNPTDTPSSPNHAGARFLTDEAHGPSVGYDYFMTFAKPVSTLALDLYDFRVDGGPQVGDTATLNLYADDSFKKIVGKATFTIKGDEVDQNVIALKVVLQCLTARSARLEFSHPDIGTGIDNITFVTVVPGNTPEPDADGQCFVLNRGKNSDFRTQVAIQDVQSKTPVFRTH